MPDDKPKRGGAREGGGRPKDAATIRTKEIASRLSNDGQPTPLEIMVATARYFYNEAKAAKSVKKRDSYYARASISATSAAPYMHSKMANLDPGTGEVEKPLMVLLGKEAGKLRALLCSFAIPTQGFACSWGTWKAITARSKSLLPLTKRDVWRRPVLRVRCGFRWSSFRSRGEYVGLWVSRSIYRLMVFASWWSARMLWWLTGRISLIPHGLPHSISAI
jgi:hypothetical protein